MDPAGTTNETTLRLEGRKVFLAYGIFGEVTARLHAIGFDYMHSLQAWLEAQRADPCLVRLDTLEPIEANGARFADAIAASPEPALVIGYSKGGVEALTALTQPSARAKCLGFIALQSPFLGSPVADVVLRPGPLSAASMTMVRGLGIGSGEGLRDLTRRARRRWMTRHAAEVAQVLAQVPTVCLATQLTPQNARGRARLYLPAARWMERRGYGPNDGLVPVSSALLPGARHLIAEGCHIESISAGGGREPVSLLVSALELLQAPVPRAPAEGDAP
ncbi:hypothetical protein [Roseomonas rosulenta]|uniref:hypothetical protein n=1 Tax=Roseomonas rosulenta TaxID=2748667 RepID=UPI0018DF9574|nr:hypothetical protein [Roseomonas rosulenta]